MKTFHLKLVPDAGIPQFQRLQVTEVDITFTQAVQQGVHLRHKDNENNGVLSVVLDAINQPEEGLAEIAAMGMADKLQADTYLGIYFNQSRLEFLLNRIVKTVYFVESLSYQELMRAANERLETIWAHEAAESILRDKFRKFDDLRMFLKSKDANLKLQGYEDLHHYDLSHILSPCDFQDAEKLVLKYGLECHTFHHAGFLSRIVNEDGFLIAETGNRHFCITHMPEHCKEDEFVPYHCTHQDGVVQFFPGLSAQPKQRQTARGIAEQWRQGEGRYCFQTGVEQVERMLEQPEYRLSFSSSCYSNNRRAVALQGVLKRVDVKRYRIGKLLTESSTNSEIKSVLKEHGIRSGGRKEALTGRLIELCAAQYEQHEAELAAYFTQHRFIRISDPDNYPYYQAQHTLDEVNYQYESFPLLHGHCLQNQLLAMFVLRHLRGNVILDGSYCNDTCTLTELAKGLIQQDVKVMDAFLRVA